MHVDSMVVEGYKLVQLSMTEPDWGMCLLTEEIKWQMGIVRRRKFEVHWTLN